MKQVFRPYQPRPVRFAGVRDVGGWSMKCYEVDGRSNARDAPGLDWNQYAGALAYAESILPKPPQAADRAGAGFLIAHEIDSHHYLIVCWWDNQNELFARCFVRPRTDAAAWDFTSSAFSFCVWDMEVMAFERQAWIQCALSAGPVDVDGYLNETFPGIPGNVLR